MVPLIDYLAFSELTRRLIGSLLEYINDVQYPPPYWWTCVGGMVLDPWSHHVLYTRR